ncbi:MAG: cell wall hydrolase [Hyphomonadaceae bacterium]|nr:cell wall hydrolase [Hyphomonadaceae bacterium]
MFWCRLGVFIDALWTDLMLELERNPLAVRQGAAAVACIAAAAIAMPVISHRAAEQREGAEWSARTLSFENHMQAQLIPGFDGREEVRLASYKSPRGLFGDETQASAVRAVLRGPFEAPPLAQDGVADAEALDQRELGCMAQAIYYEARGENVRGQVAVGEVVMNRVRSKQYPNTICGVVYQGHTRATGCQFTFTCDGSRNRRPAGRAWQRAQHVAAQVMLGHTRSVVGSSTHYHTNAVSPRWRYMLVETARLGDHVFYRLPSGSERAVLLQRAAARRAAAPPSTIEAETAEDLEVIEETSPVEAPAEAPASVEAAAPEAPKAQSVEIAA